MADARPQDFQAFLFAFALGCLDKEDFIELMEFIDAGGSFPWQELGEYQNLCALLPSFLNVEEPPAGTKDKVARRLYRYRDEKRGVEPKSAVPTSSPFARTRTLISEPAKKAVNKPQVINTLPDISHEEEEIVPPTDFKSDFSPVRRSVEGNRPQQGTQVDKRLKQTIPDRNKYSSEQEQPEITYPAPPVQDEHKAPDTSEFIINQDFDEIPSHDANDSDANESSMHLNIPESPIIQEPEAPKKSEDELEKIRKMVVENVQKESTPVESGNEQKHSGSVISARTFFLFITLLIAVIAAMYMLFTSKIDKINKSTDGKIAHEIQKVTAQKSIHQEVEQLLLNKDLLLVPLKGTYKSADAFGRIIYDMGTGTGFLQIGNLPATNAQLGYQLWIDVNGVKSPIGSPSEFGSGGLQVDYFRISKIPEYGVKQKISFFVTQENMGSTPEVPSHVTYLEAILQK